MYGNYYAPAEPASEEVSGSFSTQDLLESAKHMTKRSERFKSGKPMSAVRLGMSSSKNTPVPRRPIGVSTGPTFETCQRSIQELHDATEEDTREVPGRAGYGTPWSSAIENTPDTGALSQADQSQLRTGIGNPHLAGRTGSRFGGPVRMSRLDEEDVGERPSGIARAAISTPSSLANFLDSHLRLGPTSATKEVDGGGQKLSPDSGSFTADTDLGQHDMERSYPGGGHNITEDLHLRPSSLQTASVLAPVRLQSNPKPGGIHAPVRMLGSCTKEQLPADLLRGRSLPAHNKKNHHLTTGEHLPVASAARSLQDRLDALAGSQQEPPQPSRSLSTSRGLHSAPSLRTPLPAASHHHHHRPSTTHSFVQDILECSNTAGTHPGSPELQRPAATALRTHAQPEDIHREKAAPAERARAGQAAATRVDLAHSVQGKERLGGEFQRLSVPQSPAAGAAGLMLPPERTMPPPTVQTLSASRSESSFVINHRRYTIMKLIGKGGSSRVYEAIDEVEKCVVAIKRVDLSDVDEAQAAGFLNEINMLKQLQGQDRIVKLHDFEEVAKENILYVVMEKGDTDLASLLKEYASLKEITPAMIKHYWTEMLHAVQVIHQHGIIHSDLKPANFLLVAGRLKLIDFGIASSVQSDKTSVIKDTQTGTFNFMSPEAVQDLSGGNRDASGQLRPCIKISFKSDVWSLGCILYNLTYGRMPFGHIKIPIMKLQAIMNPEHRISFPREGVDPLLLDVLQSCLNRDPKARPSIRELLNHSYVKGEAAPKKDHLDPMSAVKLLAALEGVLSPNTMAKTRRGLTAAMQGTDSTAPPAAALDFPNKQQ